MISGGECIGYVEGSITCNRIGGSTDTDKCSVCAVLAGDGSDNVSRETPFEIVTDVRRSSSTGISNFHVVSAPWLETYSG